MAEDYNANLIAELYATTDAEKATHISDEMLEIGDPIFPRQIYEAYKRFKGTSVSHYFVSDLARFKTNDVTEILQEIAQTTDSDGDITIMIDYLTDIKYFEPELINKVERIFKNGISSGDISEYDLEGCSRYLERSGTDIEELKTLLKVCLEDDRQSLATRKIALKKLLKLDKGFIKFYYENYELIKGKKIETIFVREISTWSEGIVPLLHQKILNLGSEKAKEIIREKQEAATKQKKTKETKIQEEIKKEYQTADVISDIAELRSKINKDTTIDERFGFPLFSQLEELYQQGKPAKSRSELMGYCLVLRSLLVGFDSKIKETKINQEKIKQALPDIKDFDGSINKFHFILIEKNIDVDSTLFGLRSLNRIVAKLAAHPEEQLKPELLSILKEEGLLDHYKNSDWSILHREILLRYKAVLEKMTIALSKN